MAIPHAYPSAAAMLRKLSATAVIVIDAFCPSAETVTEPLPGALATMRRTRRPVWGDDSHVEVNGPVVVTVVEIVSLRTVLSTDLMATEARTTPGPVISVGPVIAMELTR
jgi:hypothetical protein